MTITSQTGEGVVFAYVRRGNNWVQSSAIYRVGHAGFPGYIGAAVSLDRNGSQLAVGIPEAQQ
jgi:hypothetical protein